MHYRLLHFLFKNILKHFSFSDCKPLWAFEDITPRNGTIKSADQLESFLQIIVTLFADALPHALLPGRWAREALHWATSCSSRHYAGRSFQVFRALKVPLSWPMLSDILQRLVESVADSSDDVQVFIYLSICKFLVPSHLHPPCLSVHISTHLVYLLSSSFLHISTHLVYLSTSPPTLSICPHLLPLASLYLCLSLFLSFR